MTDIPIKNVRISTTIDNRKGGRVRRYILDSTELFQVGESTPEPTTCIVLCRDHDREMAKNSQLQREAYDAIREREKQLAEKDALIAKQAMAIEKLEADLEKIRQLVQAVHFEIDFISSDNNWGAGE